MKTRDLLAIHVMRAVTISSPNLLGDKDAPDDEKIDNALDIFREASRQIHEDFKPGYFDDDEED